MAAPFAKLFLTGIPAIEASGLLYLSAGLVLGVVLGIQHLFSAKTHRRSEAALTRSDWPALFGAILFGGLIGPALLLFGLAHSSGTVASLLLNLEAVFTVLLAVLLGESLDRRSLRGVMAIILGGAILAIDPSRVGGSTLLGTLAIAGACLSWGFDNNITQRLSGRNPLVIVTLKGLFAGPIALGIAAVTGAPFPSWQTILIALVLGASGYGLSLVYFVLALRHIGSARTGSLFAVAPFIGAFASILIIGETPSLSVMIAGLVMALGTFLMTSESHEHDHEHESFEHDHAHVHDEHHQHEPEGDEPHAHPHRHLPLRHVHPHFPDLHHRHAHRSSSSEEGVPQVREDIAPGR